MRLNVRVIQTKLILIQNGTKIKIYLLLRSRQVNDEVNVRVV